MVLLVSTLDARAATSVWSAGVGEWRQAERWNPSPPDGKTVCGLHGTSQVSIAREQAVAGSLDVGICRGDNARLTVDGGTLTVLLGLRMGEYSGSRGLLELNSGVLHAATVYVGGGNYYTPNTNCCTGVLRIHGGSLVCRLIDVADEPFS